jgi:RND superfamily putative drug exporter
MRFEALGQLVGRRPILAVVVWLILALGVGLTAPSLTKIAAEGQANLLPRDAESVRIAELVAKFWPDQSSQSTAVVALERTGGLTPEDRRYAGLLAGSFETNGRPNDVLRVLGPRSAKEVAERLASKDGTMQLVAVPMSTSFVSPSAHRAVAWLQGRAAELAGERPAGLEILWTGDAVIGRDYMANVQQSLNRAAVATVVLLLIVLLAVYRSLLVALVPLMTIGVSLVVSRGVLAWLATAGWEVSPLVELFLVVILFGSGTDFCLFLAWRFGEHWEGNDPAHAMAATLHASAGALMTSAGTVIAGLSLMGTTRFKLFSSTGPSVALGLALTLVAALTLTPALLVLVARFRPRSFGGLTAPRGTFWERLAGRTLGRPLLTWLVTLAVMTPAAVIGLRTAYTQDTLAEMPPSTPSVRALNEVAARFGPGFLSPLTLVVVSESEDGDLKKSEGLALIDDASRLLSQNRKLIEVRSATQPLGSAALLEPARIISRLRKVNDGFRRIAEGAGQLRDGLLRGVTQVRFSEMLDSVMKGKWGFPRPPAPAPASPTSNGSPSNVAKAPSAAKAADQRELMIQELQKAAEGAAKIADGSIRARQEVSEILEDPVGRHALDRLLITPRTMREHPELLRSFAAYISPDGKAARFDLTQDERMNSEGAMNQVVELRRRVGEHLSESRWLRVSEGFTGSNANAADIRALTRSDQHKTWIIVPVGVFIILLLALRDPFACLNLVATMLLTYAFALGITHAVFVDLLGDEGLDWKVPYFLFVLLVAVGVDYNVFLMSRLQEETRRHGLRDGIRNAVAATGGLITSAAAITACSFASLLLSPLSSLRQLGFALVVGVTVDAVLVRPVLVPCGHWLMKRRLDRDQPTILSPLPETPKPTPAPG